MVRGSIFVIAGSLVLGGCAIHKETPNNFSGQRTVFHNPYVAPELDERLAGPGELALAYPGRGAYAYDQDGNRVRLSRSQRRYFRLQREVLAGVAERERLRSEMQAREADAAPPPVPSAPPTASQGAATPR